MSEQIITLTEIGGIPQVICSDCGMREYLSKGGIIRHSSRCDHRDAQYFQAKPAAPDAKGRVHSRMRDGNGLTPDELLDAVRKGYLSQSQAMNTDF